MVPRALNIALIAMQTGYFFDSPAGVYNELTTCVFCCRRREKPTFSSLFIFQSRMTLVAVRAAALLSRGLVRPPPPPPPRLFAAAHDRVRRWTSATTVVSSSSSSSSSSGRDEALFLRRGSGRIRRENEGRRTRSSGRRGCVRDGGGGGVVRASSSSSSSSSSNGTYVDGFSDDNTIGGGVGGDTTTPSCPVCRVGPAAELYVTVASQHYFRCPHCSATFLDPSNRLSLEAEKQRYELHENDVDSPAGSSSNHTRVLARRLKRDAAQPPRCLTW